MPSADGWGGRYVHQGQIPGGFGQPLDLDDLTDITLDDDELRGSIELEISPPALFHSAPYYSVSQSEGGFEKIMQAVTLRLEWPAAAGELLVSLEIKAKGEVSKEEPSEEGIS
jgi:4-alpha-glucanotransferase/alpha-amylase